MRGVLLLWSIAELLSEAISTAPSEIFLYQTTTSMMVNPTMNPTSSLLYVDWSSVVQIIQFVPSTH